MCPYIYITLPSYGVMAFVGGFVVLLVVYLRLENFAIAFDVFLKLFAAGGIGGWLGSKLLFAVTQIPKLLTDFSFENLLLLIPQSGYVFYGGLFGLLGILAVCTSKDRELRKRIWQMIAPAIPLFHGFGRIGCMMAGCCYGRRLQKTILLFGIFEINRVPVQIMEAAYEFFLFAVILVTEKYKSIDGLKLYLSAYAVFRFGIEFFRGDAIRGIFWGLSTAQWISVFILIYYVGKRFFLHLIKCKEE